MAPYYLEGSFYLLLSGTTVVPQLGVVLPSQKHFSGCHNWEALLLASDVRDQGQHWPMSCTAQDSLHNKLSSPKCIKDEKS